MRRPIPSKTSGSNLEAGRSVVMQAIGLLLIFGLVTLLPAREKPATEAQLSPKRDTPSLKVDVNLVLVNATVTDMNHRIVTGLEKEHFQVYEDKIKQEIIHFSSEDVPVSIGLLFDVSSSMSDKLAQAKDAAVAFLKTSNPDDEFFLLTFADRPKSEEEFTYDIAEIQNRLVYKNSKGCTTLYDSIYLALNKMKQGQNPKKAILIITDGEDTCSRYSMVNVRNAVKEADVQIFAIGIVTSYYSDFSYGRSGRSVLEELSEITGGKAYFPNSVYELEDICTKIAIELKNQYILGYSSTNPAKDGRWRKIKVKLNLPKGLPPMMVRSKTGYYAPVELSGKETDNMKKTTVLRKAIMERRAVVVPGCHDALSAKVIERSGFEAVQVSGFGVAGSLLGKPDVGLVQMKDVLDITWNIAQAVSLPVMADVDTGGGNAVNAAALTERLIEMGLAGMNIEDQVFPKRCGHMAGKEVIPGDEMAGKVRACAKIRDRLDNRLHHQCPDRRLCCGRTGRGCSTLQCLLGVRCRSGLYRRHWMQERY